jgi:hypothetical protein
MSQERIDSYIEVELHHNPDLDHNLHDQHRVLSQSNARDALADDALERFWENIQDIVQNIVAIEKESLLHLLYRDRKLVIDEATDSTVRWADDYPNKGNKSERLNARENAKTVLDLMEREEFYDDRSLKRPSAPVASFRERVEEARSRLLKALIDQRAESIRVTFHKHLRKHPREKEFRGEKLTPKERVAVGEITSRELAKHDALNDSYAKLSLEGWIIQDELEAEFDVTNAKKAAVIEYTEQFRSRTQEARDKFRKRVVEYDLAAQEFNSIWERRTQTRGINLPVFLVAVCGAIIGLFIGRLIFGIYAPELFNNGWWFGSGLAGFLALLFSTEGFGIKPKTSTRLSALVVLSSVLIAIFGFLVFQGTLGFSGWDRWFENLRQNLGLIWMWIVSLVVFIPLGLIVKEIFYRENEYYKIRYFLMEKIYRHSSEIVGLYTLSEENGFDAIDPEFLDSLKSTGAPLPWLVDDKSTYPIQFMDWWIDYCMPSRKYVYGPPWHASWMRESVARDYETTLRIYSAIDYIDGPLPEHFIREPYIKWWSGYPFDFKYKSPAPHFIAYQREFYEIEIEMQTDFLKRHGYHGAPTYNERYFPNGLN